VNVEEWSAELAVRPATDNQVGCLHRHFERLGYRRADRDDRLATCAALLGLDGLATMTDLRQGQAGQLARMLAGIRTRAQLAAAPGAQLPPDSPGARARAMFARWEEAEARKEAARWPASAKTKTRLLAQLVSRYLAAELAARQRQEGTRDAR